MEVVGDFKEVIWYLVRGKKEKGDGEIEKLNLWRDSWSWVTVQDAVHYNIESNVNRNKFGLYENDC